MGNELPDRSHVVRVTNVEAVRAPAREKNPAPPKKKQHNSGFLDGFWALWDDSGAGGTRLDHSEWT